MARFGKFTYPFRYVPHQEVVDAAQELIRRLDSDVPGVPSTVLEDLRKGKMMGVLIGSGPLGTVISYAFSGTAGGVADVEGFAPPIYDLTRPEGYFRKREAEISQMADGPEKAAASAELQGWIFSKYEVLNAFGERMDIAGIFALRGLVPPGGTGDCAAPKLLQQAYLNGIKPLAMGEFWYGASPKRGVREQGRFYPSCMGKCGPLLSWMMQGLDVEQNPLDEGYRLTEEPEVIYSDEHIIVAEKPAGMLSVPGRTSATSLLEWLRERYGLSVESCHRLDMDTSGVMVFARSVAAKIELERQFAKREVEKSYRARLVPGNSPFRHLRKGTIALPLSSDYYDRPRQIVDYENGKQAVTRYEVLEELPDGSLEVRFFPLTGRSHQLRVHSAHPDGLGRPIKGDCLYGAPEAGRLWLQADRISFRHPATGERMEFESGLR